LSYLSSIELALRDGSRALAAELQDLLGACSVEGHAHDSIGEHVDAALRRLEALLIHDAWPTLPFAAELQRLAETLRAWRDAATESHAVLWPRLQQQLSEAYDALAQALSAEVADVRLHRPANYVRSGFHVASALVCLVLTLVVFTPAQLPWAAAAFAGTAWALEISRRISPAANERLMAFFAPIAHAAEARRVNSATWYMTSLVVLAATGSTMLAVVGVAVLGFGDPLAGLVGRRFGRVELLHGRTLEGSLAFFVTGTLAAFGASWLVPSHPAPGIMLLTAAAASLAGAAAELFSRRVDDNLSIPLSAAVGAALALFAAGVSPWG
jgi:dolichol kinase